MELIQELEEIAYQLRTVYGSALLHSESLRLAVQIQRNRILEDSFLSGPSENLSFLSPEAKELLKKA
jgi:hypothetical protein